MKRGEVYWYKFRAPDKRRPVVILTRNFSIPLLTTVTVERMRQIMEAIYFSLGPDAIE